MKLTTKGRYAVSAMADLAATGRRAPVALSDVALRQGISLSYLEQLFAKLKRSGLVESARGAAGGYWLVNAPADIRIADIIAAVDEEIRTTACASGSSLGCQGTTARCLTHDLWDELGRQIEIFLNAVSLEDILQKRVLGMAAVNAPSERSPDERPYVGAAE
ncbi:MAG: Rrf2 family transcriptional regulator [Alphaproteobacteria bacterium]|nr:Rrf2 family transcriptional regulator [Alphaproteobacteria bacterium]